MGNNSGSTERPGEPLQGHKPLLQIQASHESQLSVDSNDGGSRFSQFSSASTLPAGTYALVHRTRALTPTAVARGAYVGVTASGKSAERIGVSRSTPTRTTVGDLVLSNGATRTPPYYPPNPGYLNSPMFDSVRESLLRKEAFLKAKICTVSPIEENTLDDLLAELRSVQQAMGNRRSWPSSASSETFAGPTGARLPAPPPPPPLISTRDSLVRKAEFLTTKIEEYHAEMFGKNQRALVERRRAYSGAPVDVSKLV